MLARILAVTALLLAPTAGNAAEAAIFQAQATKDFAQVGISTNLGGADSFMISFIVIGLGGKVAVCGLYFSGDGGLRRHAKKILKAASISMDDKVFIKDLGFFNSARSSRELTSGTASCKVTQTPVPRKAVTYSFGLDDVSVRD